MKKQNLYNFNEVATKTGVKSQTLRNWEKAGIIKATEVVGTHKLFSNQNIAEIQKIKELKRYNKKVEQGKEEIGMGAPNTKKEIKNNMTKVDVNKMNKKTKIDYSIKSIDELNELARQKGIKYFRQMNKSELVEALTYPKKTMDIVESVKNRTREKYGNKKYGQVGEKLSTKTHNFNITTVRNILSLNKKGLTAKEIFEKLN